MRYKIGICDDSEADSSYVKGLVSTWAVEKQMDVQMDIFPSAEAFLFHYAEQKDYDILLLDVEMGEMDGVSMARRIRQENEMVQIVFITGYSDYIAEGYEVAALHYLMKPVRPEKLYEVLDRAVAKVQKNEQVLTLELSGEMIRIPLYEIRYLDVHQNYVTVHARQDYTMKRTLGEFVGALDDRFYRAGRSCIVNLTCIERVSRTDIYLKDGTGIPLPRGQYEQINRAIIARL